jgi:phospholipase/carboxylesterase
MNLNKLFFVLFIWSFSFAQKINTDLTYSVNPSKLKNNAPVLILLHGYGSSENDLISLAKSLDERFITFSLRAPFNGREVGYSWYELSFRPNKKLSCNYNEAKQSEAKILSFISNACSAYKADSTKVFLLGFSQGAIMAYDIAIKNPKKIAGIMALSGRMLEETRKIKVDADAKNVKYFIAHGKQDNIIDVAEADSANTYLKSKEINDLTYKKYEIPHSLSGDEFNDIKAWLKKALNAAAKEPEKKR